MAIRPKPQDVDSFLAGAAIDPKPVSSTASEFSERLKAASKKNAGTYANVRRQKTILMSAYLAEELRQYANLESEKLGLKVSESQVVEAALRKLFHGEETNFRER